MTNLKKLVATVTLMGIIIIGAKDANAGFLMSDLTDGNTETCTEIKDTKDDFGVIYNLTGVIYNLTGVIYNLTGSDKNIDTNCG